MRAYVIITTEPGKSREIARQVASLPGVKMADACWGSHDVFAVIEFRESQALNELVMDKIQRLDGVRETNTHIANDESLRVSHETIYRSLFIQARGVLKKELLGHLRSKRRIRRSQHSRIFRDSRGQIADAISIRQRPAEVEDRAIPGHWEGDLLSGSRNSHVVTLVERHSRFTALVKVPGKDTAVVVAALSRQIRKLPATLRRSLTRDRGLEMAKHKTFTVTTDVKVYFCDPQSPWQRGSNENTNGYSVTFPSSAPVRRFGHTAFHTEYLNYSVEFAHPNHTGSRTIFVDAYSDG